MLESDEVLCEGSEESRVRQHGSGMLGTGGYRGQNMLEHIFQKMNLIRGSVQFSSVAQSCPTLCDPMHRSMPGLPVHHHLLEFTQTHIHRVGDAIQPFHPLSSPSPPSIRIFSNESTLRMRWPKYWSFSLSISPSNEHPGLISFRMYGLISFQSKGLARVFSSTTVQKHQFFSTQLS